MFDNSTTNAVFRIYGHPKQRLAYLGLYALQQSRAGECWDRSSDGPRIHCHKSMGHVADIFTRKCWEGCREKRHRAYALLYRVTVLLNAQRFSGQQREYRVEHNGNITNAGELRRELEKEGSIFQASSDTEVPYLP